ncbi:MAG TPA: GNAT family N-acetyltransferase [Polyangiaceae bacterium]|nr:GNAT family N-acetyltransferase [Polyangiaceae bacterium]
MASGAHVALAYLGEEVIGTVSSAFDRVSEESGEIMRLAVLPRYRGNDYGRELMMCAETQLRTAGALVAELSIVAQFRRLQSYYERLGYSAKSLKRVASLPFEVLFMEKKLL